MALSDVTYDREHHHTRTITCNGYRRKDGLWDIEGCITDVKAYSFQNDWRGTIQKGEPLHEMWIRLTVDNDLTVIAVEAKIDNSPFQICPSITPNFQRLVGLRMVTGWTKNVKQALGGVQGCTHLVDLLGPVATTAFQTIIPVLAREKGQASMPALDKEGSEKKRPPLINSCHTFSSSGDVVKKRWPEWYRDAENPENEKETD